ncbi:MAG: pitrilysin family protein, partial [Gemmatimonadetes bacterium]|nr:pitrilysin family protein [Gemmatimonadota bacterium]
MTRLSLIATLVCTVVAIPSSAQQRIAYDDYRLDNGLRVILVEDHSVPVVTIDLWYNVGSGSENRGRSGFAHLFEHMMYQGSANVAKAEMLQLVERAGGTMNATPNEDRTAYFQTLPANRLNLGLWLEADRMRSLAITQENLDNQRETVKEERRLRLDNQPYAWAIFEAPYLTYDSTSCFSYAHSVIGSMANLDAAGVENVQMFFDLYYAPNNATLTVVGDLDPREARELIRQYFGDIPPAQDPPAPSCDWSVGTEAQEMVRPDPLANLPMVAVAYRFPAHDDVDTPALSLLDLILGSGESSRLNRALVRENKSALQAQTLMMPRRLSSTLLVLAIANQGTTVDDLKQQIHDEVERIAREGVTEEELQKAKNAYRSRNVFGRQTTYQVAEQVQHFVHYHRSLDDMHTDLERYLSVTRDDILRAAGKYLAR